MGKLSICVSIKQVPDTTEAQIDSKTHSIIRTGLPSAVNPFDEFALEEALRLRERYGGEVTAISMGPLQARSALQVALAMGVDRAFLISDRAFAGSDTLATSYALSQAIRKLGDFDLYLFGKQATDGDTAQVGPGVAVRLGVPQITYCVSIEGIDLKARRIRAERLLEGGRELVEAPLPALITVTKGINKPRYPTFESMKRALEADVPVWGPEDICADPSKIGLAGSPTRVKRVSRPKASTGCEFLGGQTREAVAKLVGKLSSAGVIRKGASR
ncbi:MAG: electron transfer flavoprotein subunit beta/FixA family protein [bacterium]